MLKNFNGKNLRLRREKMTYSVFFFLKIEKYSLYKLKRVMPAVPVGAAGEKISKFGTLSCTSFCDRASRGPETLYSRFAFVLVFDLLSF